MYALIRSRVKRRTDGLKSTMPKATQTTDRTGRPTSSSADLISSRSASVRSSGSSKTSYVSKPISFAFRIPSRRPTFVSSQVELIMPSSIRPSFVVLGSGSQNCRVGSSAFRRAPGADEIAKRGRRELRVETRGLGRDLLLEIAAARPGFAAVVLEVLLAPDEPGLHRRRVDRLLEAV